MPLGRQRRKGNLLDRPVIGSVYKNPTKCTQYEGYDETSSEEKSDAQTLTKIPKVVENFYTDRLFGEPIENHYSKEPTTKEDLKELESNAKNDLVLIKQVFKSVQNCQKFQNFLQILNWVF